MAARPRAAKTAKSAKTTKTSKSATATKAAKTSRAAGTAAKTARTGQATKSAPPARPSPVKSATAPKSPAVPAARPVTAPRPAPSTGPSGTRVAPSATRAPSALGSPSLARPTPVPLAPGAPRIIGSGTVAMPRRPTAPVRPAPVRVGTGKWTYDAIADWGRGPEGVPEFGTVSGVACDSRDNVYVFQRTIEPCVLVFTPDGRFLRKFGGDTFRHPHGIWIGKDASRGGEEVCLLTDRDLHQVIKYNLEGRKLATWGAAYREPGDAGQPFNQPARATLSPKGEMYVADGYGQYRVHHFTPEGELAHSWGKRGKGPGEFGWPVHHALLDPRNRVIVSDRGNNRLQLFSPRGKYLAEWGDLRSPQDYVVTRDEELFVCEGATPGIAVLDLDGNVLGRWGERGTRPGQFAASPHSLWVDSRGDLYIGEVIDPNRLTKFVRR